MDLSTRTDNSDKASDGLLLNPSTELKFRGPFDDFVTVTLSIQNPTDKRIAFKIKTTAPKRYCVKPNSGVLNPTEAIKVNVLLQPFQYDPSEKNKHKFMVQYVYLSEEERKMNANDILNLWKDMPAERLLDIKLRCTFEPSDNEVTSTQTTTTTTASQQTTPPVTTATGVSSSQPTQQPTVTKTTSNTNNTSSIQSNSVPVAQVSVQPLNDSKLSSRSLRSSDSTTSNTIKSESSLNDLKEENEKLKKEIDRLKEEESRLRKMALQDSSKKSQTTNAQQQFDIQQLILNKSIWVIVLLIAIIIYLLFIK